MPKSVEFCQLVSRSISHTTWNIPRNRDGDRSFTSPRDNNFFPPEEAFSQVLSQVLIQFLLSLPSTSAPGFAPPSTQWRLLKG